MKSEKNWESVKGKQTESYIFCHKMSLSNTTKEVSGIDMSFNTVEKEVPTSLERGLAAEPN